MGRPTAHKPSSPYSVHPGVTMVQEWIANLPEKTGKSLDEWIAVVHSSGLTTAKERREWLKSHHKLGTNSAWWIADRAEGKGTEDSDPEAYLLAAGRYVDAMFAGSKAGLRPIYEQLLKVVKKAGKDVKICPCQTIVPLYRIHVFAQIKPTTRTRIDMGFALKDEPPVGRLVSTGGFEKGDRISHRIPITSLAEIDEEVQRWLKIAYDRDV
jgi:hypothetical protein